MKNLKKIFLGMAIYFFFIPIVCASVLESTSDYKEDMYIVGSTRFLASNVITSTSTSIALANEEKLALTQGLDPDTIDLKTYYYSALFDEWYILDSNNNATLLTLSEEQSLEEHLNIFYVDNVEKIVEFEYLGVVDLDSLSEGVTYQNGKFYIPATSLSITFTSSGNPMVLETIKNGDDYLFGSFYIPYQVLVYDELGNLLNTFYTDSKGFIDTEKLYQETKEGMRLIYVTEDGEEVRFDNALTENLKIIKKWIPIGSLQAENGEFNHLEFVYHGNLSILEDSNKNSFMLRVYAPKMYNPNNAVIKYQEKQVSFLDAMIFDSSSLSYYVEIPVEFESKDDKVTIDVVWDDANTSTFQVLLGEDAKFEHLVTFYVDDEIYYVEKVLEGNRVQEVTTPIKEGYTFLHWTYNDEVFDNTTPITDSISLKAVFEINQNENVEPFIISYMNDDICPIPFYSLKREWINTISI